MKEFEYDVTLHPTETFQKVALFCSTEGECNMERVPADEVEVLKKLLNERGRSGWELVQVSFGEGGLMAMWKREVTGAVIRE